MAVEVDFSPLLDAVSKFGVFQRRHLRDFGRLVVGRDDDRNDGEVRPGTAMLIARDRNRAVSAGRDQLAAITYSYADGFLGFVRWARCGVPARKPDPARHQEPASGLAVQPVVRLTEGGRADNTQRAPELAAEMA